jgi:hypothetical protein
MAPDLPFPWRFNGVALPLSPHRPEHQQEESIRMVCYAPSTGTLAVIGVGIYVLWHKTIGHLLGLFGTVLEIVVILGVEVGVAIFLVWLTRSIRRRRAQSGACTTCRFRCQQALSARPNLLVNVVDRRVPAAARPALTCHPAAPLLPVRATSAARRLRPAALPSVPLRPALRRLRPAALTSSAVPAALPRAHGNPRFMGPVPAPFSVRGPVQAPAVSPLPPSASRISPPVPAPPAAAPVVAAAAPEPEAVDVDGYVLTPDGVDTPDSAGAQPATA